MRGPRLALALSALLAASCHRGVLDEPAASDVLPRIECAAALPNVALRAPAASIGTAALDALPWEQRIGLEQALAASDARYAPRMDETGPVLETPGSIVATFTARGAHLSFGELEATFAVAAIGREGAMRPAVAGGMAEMRGAEVRTTRMAGVVEWWRSLPSGLEHGVTLEERPSGDGELRVEVAVGGELSATSVSNDAVELRNVGGDRLATYAHLVVLDAAGAPVPARMSVDGGRIVLAIDDAAARYPLVIDPLVTAQEATLRAPDGATSDRFGISVALTSDGSRALVGADQDDGSAGSARVFLRTGTAWAEEATLLAPDRAGGDNFGISVALASDGLRALVGAHGDDTAGGVDAGSARVFLRTGTAWAEEATLLAPDGAAGDFFGISVALTSDGGRALVGADYDDTAGDFQAGSARVFLRTGTAWVHEATLVAPDGAMGDSLGISVALTSDGSRALVGANGDDTAGGVDAGSARVFLRTVNTWAQEAALLAPDGTAGDHFGTSVALTSDGSRALVGAHQDDTAETDAGSARVFLRTLTAWAQEATLLAPDGAFNDRFGISVALTSDGSRALVGAYGDETAGGAAAGSARVFLRAGTAWAQEATLLAPDGAFNDFFGVSVALTSDGSRALGGAFYDNTAGGIDTGSARVFTIALAPNGSTCGGDAACVSGFCTDGVCCDTRCAGGANDCQACTAALTGGGDGSCAFLSATTVCRAAGAACDATETCTGTSAACPLDLGAAAGAICRPVAGGCDVAETCDGTSTVCPADAVAPRVTLCRASAGTCDVEETCTGASAACPADALIGSGMTCRPPMGVCGATERCTGTTPVCPMDVAAIAGTVCRNTAGACDVEEVCDGVSFTCPGDALVAAAVVCRGPADACDATERCTGSSAACPGDLFSPAGVGCRAAVSACDVADVCTGTSIVCADAFAPAGVTCRAPAGPCDSPEVCDGASGGCPGDALVGAGIACGIGTVGTCSGPGLCDGSSSSCPSATVLAAGTVCLPAMAGNVCDVDDVCDGVTDVCAASYALAAAACGPALSGVCDAPDHCQGTTAACVAEFLVGVECRAGSGACDPAELCLGDTASCPPDQSSPAGTVCRASTDLSCDPVESCVGTASACPTDVTTCASRPDSGSAALDAGGVADAGPATVAATGCACRLTPSDTPLPAALVTLLALGMLSARRRRRR